MKICNRCHVKVMDEIKVCPLCQNVLNPLDDEITEDMYPEIEFDVHKYHIIIRVFLFFSILVGIVLMTINYLTYTSTVWSIIPVGVIIYFILTIKYSIQNNANFAAKILVQTLGAILLVVLIDIVIGYRGWSVDYAVPGIIIIANAAILILMIVNFMNWQSYLMFQIGMLLFSLIPVILYFRNIITHPVMAFVAAGFSVVTLIGTMIFGDKKAKNELMRRFHI